MSRLTGRSISRGPGDYVVFSCELSWGPGECLAVFWGVDTDVSWISERYDQEIARLLLITLEAEWHDECRQRGVVPNIRRVDVETNRRIDSQQRQEQLQREVDDWVDEQLQLEDKGPQAQ